MKKKEGIILKFIMLYIKQDGFSSTEGKVLLCMVDFSLSYGSMETLQIIASELQGKH